MEMALETEKQQAGILMKIQQDTYQKKLKELEDKFV